MATLQKSFKNVMDWIDDRLPVTEAYEKHLSKYYAPKNLNIWYYFGIFSFVVLVNQLLTGIWLTMNYVPTGEGAFASIEYIMRDVEYGWMLRYMHSTGASAFFVVVYLHMFRGLIYGSYQKPRELIWIIGVFIFLLMIATAFMGYVLPWGQMSFWAATVITNLFSAIPLVGESITNWLWGGYAVGSPLLTRFFTLHYLMPFLIFALVILHVWALHVPGNNNPEGINVVQGSQDTVPFHPHYVVKDMFALVVFLVVFAGFVFFVPNLLGHTDNYIQANPLQTPEHIVPEWYFLPFYAILRSVPDKLGGVILMVSAIAILAFLPWLDTSKVRSAKYRPLYRQFVWLFFANVILLGYLGAQTADGLFLIIGRISTAYYFAHFIIILPLLGYIEKTKPLPKSLSEPVLSPEERQMKAAASGVNT